ncbi:MAG: Smr/MutS family protein [Anaerolineales bacterium]|nr:Smr/MutS family protein [Anaerolineales bacterium]MCB8963284.1 Smr/MutS family protein [Ardenticatenales bacterium]
MDEKSLITLEFNKVREKLAGYTGFSGGQALARSLTPTTHLYEAQRWQAETAEAVMLFDRSSDVSIGGARDVRRAADNSIRGFTLPAEDLLNIRSTIIAGRALNRYLTKNANLYPHLAEIAELIEPCPGLVSAIGNTFDERGEVLDSASVKLANLRAQLRTAHGRIQEKLTRLLQSSQNQYLQEPIITMRSGRYVVPLKADARGRIKGIVHDHSGTGATLWIEPLNTVELNNEYRGLQLQEEEEINRILAALSAKVADQAESIIRVVDRLSELDLIFARARYANMLNGVRPDLVDWREFEPPRPPKHANERAKWTPPPRNPHPGSVIWIKAARHPLLDPATVVPTDLLLEEDIFHVLITGPNTGGKTVSLKTIGLMALMAQSGLHLPAVDARMTVFDNVFADIGDEQSIEQSLSTFSGHISNIIRILNQVDERSLVVLDELGSGTDPAEGAAIAQAIVNFLRDKGATTFVATHYPELKIYAAETPGATNASLLFDEETLSPTYEMTIGLPGRSNAVAIARRLGLDETIITDALALLGQGSSAAETMLGSIYDIREKMLSDEAATRVARKQAEETKEELEARLRAIEAERETVLIEARARAEAELNEVREEIRRAQKRLRSVGSATSVKKLKQDVDKVAEDLANRPVDAPLTDSLPEPEPEKKKPAKPARKHFLVGDNVLVKTLNVKGDIVSLDKKEAEVAIGRMKMRVALTDLELKEREEPQLVESGAPRLAREAASPGAELDLRGERIEEGLERLEQYLDQAFLANLPWVRIIHGKGTGRLRTAVRKVLAKHRDVNSWEEGKDGEGGSGVTVAKFKE